MPHFRELRVYLENVQRTSFYWETQRVRVGTSAWEGKCLCQLASCCYGKQLKEESLLPSSFQPLVIGFLISATVMQQSIMIEGLSYVELLTSQQPGSTGKAGDKVRHSNAFSDLLSLDHHLSILYSDSESLYGLNY